MAELNSRVNNRENKLEALQDLIDKRNIKAKEAEQELILFIKNRPIFKNNYKFHTNDIVQSIDYITSLAINNNTYPKLSEWKKLNTQVNKNIIDLPTNTKTNYNKIEIIAEGKNHGFDVDAIRQQLPKSPTVYNRLTTLLTRKNTAKSYLPTQQNPQNNIRPASAVQSVPTATPSKSSWWPFGGGRKTHRKPSGSRGGNIYMSMDEASIHQKISNMQQEYPTKSEEDKIRLAREIQNARNALNAILTQEHNTLVREQNSRRIGGRKTHHKKRHMRKGSRKIHRK